MPHCYILLRHFGGGKKGVLADSCVMQKDDYVLMAEAAFKHSDGWRSAFIPLVDDEEADDRAMLLEQMLQAAQSGGAEGLASFLIAETAYYAAFDPQTKARWNVYHELTYLEWERLFPEAFPCILDALDPRINRDALIKRLEQLLVAQHAVG